MTLDGTPTPLQEWVIPYSPEEAVRPIGRILPDECSWFKPPS